ncbi:hypothetical protein [Paenibacillus xylanilyticus]|uniref:Uncharacterized protein n=1 Tax=Paenibacillus xylanilyticus TaxID=248903 RepID=A0A7Y6BVG8_9BACL|nr:hypothetical protein [Paenibacillus xylanilyticus]NUU75748.1 hypothetical protein [Paenibacillus xylanilyticus]
MTNINISKKVAYFIAIAIILIVAYVFIIPNDSEAAISVNTEKEVFSARADYPVIDTVNQLDENADLIVSGKYTGNREAFFQTDDQGEIVIRASKSEFEVNQVYKGNLTNGIITVAEPAYEDEEAVYTIEGYNLMDIYDDYVLFLGESDTGAYRIVGMYQGQYQIDSDLSTQSFGNKGPETVYFENDQLDHYSSLKEQVFDFLLEAKEDSNLTE